MNQTLFFFPLELLGFMRLALILLSNHPSLAPLGAILFPNIFSDLNELSFIIQPYLSMMICWLMTGCAFAGRQEVLISGGKTLTSNVGSYKNLHHHLKMYFKTTFNHCANNKLRRFSLTVCITWRNMAKRSLRSVPREWWGAIWGIPMTAMVR